MFLTELRGQAGGAEPSGRRLRSTAIAAGALVALTVVAGCASDGGVDTEIPVAASAPAEARAEPSASPSSPAEENAILAAYREFFTRQTEISAAPADERRELLEPFTTDPALDRVLRGMFGAEDLGEVGYGVPVLDPAVASIDGDEATVIDCQDTSDFGRKDEDSGDVVTRGVDAVKVEVKLRRESGSWRIAHVDYLEGSC